MIRALLALLLSCALAACSAEDGRNDWPTPSPALWEVTAPNGQRGWLFGTIHALPRGANWRTPALDAALADAGLLVVETAELNDDRRAAAEFDRRAHSTGLPPLLQRVSPRARPALAAALDRADMEERDLATIESWAAALTLLNAGRAGDTGHGVDRALLRTRLPVVGLESHAQLFGIFDALAPEDQRHLLELAAEMRDPADERAMTEAWLTGDLRALEQSLQRDILSDPELREALLVRRNAAWLPRVAQLVEQGRRPVVAVGAAHLIGDVGIPAQLAAKGYKVRRIQ